MNSIEILGKLVGFQNGKTVIKMGIANEMKWNEIQFINNPNIIWHEFHFEMKSFLIFFRFQTGGKRREGKTREKHHGCVCVSTVLRCFLRSEMAGVGTCRNQRVQAPDSPETSRGGIWTLCHSVRNNLFDNMRKIYFIYVSGVLSFNLLIYLSII